MVAAFNLGRDRWNMCPEGFDGDTYNSPQKTYENTQPS
jgi:hypothetical protein